MKGAYSLLYPIPSYHILPRPTLASSASLPLPCPTFSYPILHSILLPSYLSQPHPTLSSTALLTSSYTGSFCESTLYYLILPHLTTSYPVLLLSTPPYVVFYCHPTLDSTPSYLSLIFILPQLTTAYPVAPSGVWAHKFNCMVICRHMPYIVTADQIV